MSPDPFIPQNMNLVRSTRKTSLSPDEKLRVEVEGPPPFVCQSVETLTRSSQVSRSACSSVLCLPAHPFRCQGNSFSPTTPSGGPQNAYETAQVGSSAERLPEASESLSKVVYHTPAMRAGEPPFTCKLEGGQFPNMCEWRDPAPSYACVLYIIYISPKTRSL